MIHPIFYVIYSTTTVEFLILSILSILCFRKKTELSIYMGFIFIFTAIAIIGYLFGFGFIYQTISKIGFCFYFSSITLMLNSLYLFCVKYSGFKTEKSLSKPLSIIISSADCTILFLLTIFKNLPNPQQVFFYGKYTMVMNPSHWYFNVHLAIAYIYSLGTICLLVYKACSTPKHNRSKYINTLIAFMLPLTVNGIALIWKFHFDATNYIYGLAALVTYLFCFKYRSPQYLLHTVQNILNDDSRMIICFDENHNCTWYNKSMKDFLKGVTDIPTFLETEFEKWRNTSTQFDDMEDEFTRIVKLPLGDTILDFDISLHKKRDDLDNYLGCYYITTDITEKLKSEEKQKLLLGMDKLTEIPNRDYFFSNVKKTLKSKTNTTFLLICSNIVDFKIYNNIFGEEAGNAVLRRCAGYISDHNNISPAFGRISGDMFAMLLPEERYRDEPFLDVMNKMETEFSNSFYNLHMQMGVYKITNINEPVSSMCEKAILSMKLRKHDASKHISWFTEDNLDQNLREKMVMGKFEQALRNGEFKMFLQPQVTKDNKVLGAEALARWIDEDGKIIPPDRFIPILEKNNIITKLDRFIWEEAAKQLDKWSKMGRDDLHIAVNISVKDFYHEDLYKIFTDLVEKYNIEPKRLKLEITETAIISDTVAINNLLQKLRQFGFEIELDDFGSGYSSLGLLKDISVDTIKIDMSFLRRSEYSSEEKAWLIIQEIASLAKVLKMDTIVEGVEEEEQVKKLVDFGCNIFQGYYFAMPETISSFEERVKIIK